jgi:CspA family cold shock protein
VDSPEVPAGCDESDSDRRENSSLLGKYTVRQIFPVRSSFKMLFEKNRYTTLIRAVGVRTVAMASGKVDFFNDTGGYGFIETEDSDEDVFFHMEDVGGEDLTEGTEIEFDIEQAPKGPRAKNVVRV